MHLVVVELRVENEIAHALHAIRLNPLPLEVAGVLDLELGSDERVIVDLLADTDGLEQSSQRNFLPSRDFRRSSPTVGAVRCSAAARTGAAWSGWMLVVFASSSAESSCSQSRLDHRCFGARVHARARRQCAQTPQRVVLPHRESELRARCEEPIRLVDAASDEIVDQHADVGSLAAQNDGRLSPVCASAALMPATSPCPAASS